MKWAVSLVILHMVTSIFLQGLCGYIWVNILTLSPRREHLPTDCFIEISLHSMGHFALVLILFPALYIFCINLVGFLNG